MMKLNKATLVSSLGLSVIHFLIVFGLMKFRPDFLNSGEAEQVASVIDKIEGVLTQPGEWVADFMGCIYERPMWWVFIVLNSVLWGNVIAFVLRTLSKAFVKNSPSEK